MPAEPAERIVIDANVAIDLAGRELFEDLGARWLAPSLLREECCSALHAVGAATDAIAYSAVLHQRILDAPIEYDDTRAADDVWSIATELTWRKTYDAEYLSLARRHDLPLATLDARMRAAAVRVGVRVVDLP